MQSTTTRGNAFSFLEVYNGGTAKVDLMDYVIK